MYMCDSLLSDLTFYSREPTSPPHFPSPSPFSSLLLLPSIPSLFSIPSLPPPFFWPTQTTTVYVSIAASDKVYLTLFNPN